MCIVHKYSQCYSLWYAGIHRIPTRKGQGLPYTHLYPLKKVRRYVTTSLWQNFHMFIHKFTPSVLRSKHWLYRAVFLLMTSAIALLFRFQLTGRGHPKNAPLLRVATKAYHLHVFYAHLNIQKSLKHSNTGRGKTQMSTQRAVNINLSERKSWERNRMCWMHCLLKWSRLIY